MKMKSKSLRSDLPQPEEKIKGWPFDEEVDPESYGSPDALPKISIVTPSYNQGRFIEQTIRSVLLQNYPNLEYIIIDGGSNDNTVEIIKKYEPWIKYWVSEKDLGQSNAINKGIEKCEGDIFAWLNSDDYYEKVSFKKIASLFKSDNPDIIIGSCRFNDEIKKEEKIIDFRLRKSLEETIALVLINQPAVFYKMDVVKKTGKLDEKLHCVMDQDFWKRYLFQNGMNKVRVTDDILTYFRYHHHSKTHLMEFTNEYGKIFKSIAERSGMKNYLNVLDKIYGTGVKDDYEFAVDFDEDQIQLAKKVINNVIFYNAKTSFSKKNMKMFEACFPLVQCEYLNEIQNRYMRSLKLKSMLIKLKLEPIVDLMTPGRRGGNQEAENEFKNKNGLKK